MPTKRRYLSENKGLLIINMYRESKYMQGISPLRWRPYFDPPQNMEKTLRSKGEMAQFEGDFFWLVKFWHSKLYHILLRCSQNLHVVLTLMYCSQTSADFSPSPRWLTTHIFCGRKLTFFTKPRREQKKFTKTCVAETFDYCQAYFSEELQFSNDNISRP